jgi:metal-responsive CopG/Arc/MetJ family transcriptional regulator
METAKVAISINKKTLKRLDRLVKDQVFANRSKAIQEAIEDKLNRLERTRLSRECAKLDPIAEQTMAEEGISEELHGWPEY